MLIKNETLSKVQNLNVMNVLAVISVCSQIPSSFSKFQFKNSNQVLNLKSSFNRLFKLKSNRDVDRIEKSATGANSSVNENDSSGHQTRFTSQPGPTASQTIA